MDYPTPLALLITCSMKCLPRFLSLWVVSCAAFVFPGCWLHQICCVLLTWVVWFDLRFGWVECSSLPLFRLLLSHVFFVSCAFSYKGCILSGLVHRASVGLRRSSCVCMDMVCMLLSAILNCCLRLFLSVLGLLKCFCTRLLRIKLLLVFSCCGCHLSFLYPFRWFLLV